MVLAEAGCDVGITCNIDEAGAEDTAEEARKAGRRAEVCQLDLTALPAAAGTIDGPADARGGCDILVNNAGTGSGTPFLELSLAEFRRVLEVDLVGAFVCVSVLTGPWSTPAPAGGSST